MVDFETEYWYKVDKVTIKKKKSFQGIKDKPEGWDSLFTLPKKDGNRRNFQISKKEYNQKLEGFFNNKAKAIRFITACMKHAYQELNASFVVPPSPLIIDSGISTDVALAVNKTFNIYCETFGLFKAVFYNLHPNVLDYKSVHKKIIDQIYEIEPDIVLISGVDCDKYLFPKNIYKTNKPMFDKFISDIAIYSKTSDAIVLWYDKGYYSSSYGLKLIKEGIDGFIYPLSGHSKESDGGKLAYGNILNEYSYCSWQKFLKLSKKEIPCHNLCCANINIKDLKEMTYHSQWKFKRIHELVVRNSQIDYILEKLNKENKLIDFSVRLERNLIED